MTIALVNQEQIETLSAIVERLDAGGFAEEGRMLREVVAQLGASQQEVPPSTAAKILRVTPQTVRNWVRAGIVPGRRDRTGHFHVRLDALEPTIRLNQLMPSVEKNLATITDEEIEAEIQAVRAARQITAAKR